MIIKPKQLPIIPISKGGTNATSVQAARQNLGVIYSNYLELSADYTVTTEEDGYIFTVDTSGGDKIITMPLAASAGVGFTVTIRKNDSTSNKVTVSPSGTDTIAGPQPRQLLIARQNITLVSNGINQWVIVSEFNSAIDSAGSVFTREVAIANVNSSGGPAGGIKSSVFLQIGNVPFDKSNYVINGTTVLYEAVYIATTDSSTVGELRLYDVTSAATVAGTVQSVNGQTLQIYTLALDEANLPGGTDHILELQGRTTSGAGKVYVQYGGIRITNTII